MKLGLRTLKEEDVLRLLADGPTLSQLAERLSREHKENISPEDIGSVLIRLQDKGYAFFEERRWWRTIEGVTLLGERSQEPPGREAHIGREQLRRDIPSISEKSYLFVILVILASSYLQYLIGGIGAIADIFLVYGLPTLVITLVSKGRIVRKALNNMYDATKYGLAYYGAFTVLNMVLAVIIVYLLATFDSTALGLLDKPNPVLQTTPEQAWVMIWFSLLIVGPLEEYIFRGFVFGALVDLFKEVHWFYHALVASVVFAAVHLYYAFVYGVASLIPFTDLITFGLAMASTYYLSGGNILVPALIHGIFDAAAFADIATSSGVGTLLRSSLTFLGIILAIILFIQRVVRSHRLRAR